MADYALRIFGVVLGLFVTIAAVLLVKLIQIANLVLHSMRKGLAISLMAKGMAGAFGNKSVPWFYLSTSEQKEAWDNRGKFADVSEADSED